MAILLSQLLNTLPTRPHECFDAPISQAYTALTHPRFSGAHGTGGLPLPRTLLGWGWTLLNLLMLAVYTFVFSTVFKALARPARSRADRFCHQPLRRLIVYSLFSECIGKAPTWC